MLCVLGNREVIQQECVWMEMDEENCVWNGSIASKPTDDSLDKTSYLRLIMMSQRVKSLIGLSGRVRGGYREIPPPRRGQTYWIVCNAHVWTNLQATNSLPWWLNMYCRHCNQTKTTCLNLRKLKWKKCWDRRTLTAEYWSSLSIHSYLWVTAPYFDLQGVNALLWSYLLGLISKICSQNYFWAWRINRRVLVFYFYVCPIPCL